MKKNLLYSGVIAIALTVPFITGSFNNVTTAHASATKSIELYNVKKDHRTYKVTKAANVLVNKVKTFGSQHKYNGKTYYYVNNLHKYTDKTGYTAVNKYYTDLAKKQSDAFGKSATKNNDKKNTKSNTTTTTPHIVDGYDETNQKIVDVNTFTNVLEQTALNKLNAFRQSQGLPILTIDNNLMKVAKVRAQQRALLSWSATSDEVHNDSNGTPYIIDVEKQLGLTPNDGNENAAKFDLSGLDKTTDIGNAAIQEEIDEGTTGGHYQNDVATNVTKVGIGFYVDQSSNAVGYVADFQ